MNKKEAAKTLYLSGYTQERIAEFFRVNINTVSRWCVDGQWHRSRASDELMRTTLTEDMLFVLAYQARALRARVELFEREWNDAPDTPPKLVDKGEFDALNKAFAVIRKESRSWEDYVKITKEVTEYLFEVNPDLAKDFAPVVDVFLHEKRKVL